jgi:hypothetical protein
MASAAGSSRPAQQSPAVYQFAAPALLPRLRQRRRPQGGKRVSRWTFAAGRITALAAFLFEVISMLPEIIGVLAGGVLAGVVIFFVLRAWD